MFEHSNKPTLIKFWASWCPLCLSELEQTQALATDPELARVNLWTLASPGVLGEMPLADFQRWYSSLDYPDLPLQLDPKGEWVRHFGVQVYPTWVLLSPDGKLLRQVRGSLSKEQILTLLDNFAQDFTDRYMTLTGIVFILVLLFAPAGIAGIGKQVKRAVDRARSKRSEADESPQQEPPAEQPTGEAITKGKQQ